MYASWLNLFLLSFLQYILSNLVEQIAGLKILDCFFLMLKNNYEFDQNLEQFLYWNFGKSFDKYLIYWWIFIFLWNVLNQFFTKSRQTYCQKNASQKSYLIGYSLNWAKLNCISIFWSSFSFVQAGLSLSWSTITQFRW